LTSFKRAVLAAVEGLWALLFAAAGRVLRRSASPWSSGGGQRILVVAPHPDDEVAGCAGTIVRHKQAGDTVWVAYVTDGRRSRALGLGPEEMARRRRGEAEAAAVALDLDGFEWLGCPEGEWTPEELRPRLLSLLRRCAPHVVYAPSRVDFHPEHQRVAHTLASLFDEAEPRPPLIRVYQIQVPLTPVLTNLVGATSGVMAESAAAFRAYVTQQGSVGCAFRSRRYAARFYDLGGQAEEFWQMSARQYHLLHRLPREQEPRRAFRSLRARSLADPLAYLVGLAARRRLAAAVQSVSAG